MKVKPGILLGIPVLLFVGWFIWTNLIAYQDFSSWAREIPQRFQVVNPEAVSHYRAGELSDFPGHIYQLSPRTEEQRIREEKFWQSIREERSDFDRNALDTVHQRWYDQLAIHESRYLDMPWQWWAMNLYNPYDGAHLELLELLIYKHHIGEVTDCEGYTSRLKAFPVRLREAMTETKKVATQGWVLDSLALNQTIRQLQILIQTPVKQHAAYRSFATRMTRLDPTVINEYQQLDFLIEASRIIEEEWKPALLEILTELKQLPKRPPGMDHLPVNLFEQQIAVCAGKNLSLDSISAPHEFADFPAPSTTQLPISVEPGNILDAIRQATGGILPAYPDQSLRVRVADSSQIFPLPGLMSGSSDLIRYPTLLVSGSGIPAKTALDIYQYGLPGAGWLAQLELESGASVLTQMFDQEARYEAWGLASLDLLQEKLLWYSRDSLMMDLWQDRVLASAVLASIDLEIHRPGGGLDHLEEISWWANLAPAMKASILVPILSRPGMAVARAHWYKHWNVRLRSCKWEVSCAIGTSIQ